MDSIRNGGDESPVSAQHVSVVIPTRGRAESAERAISSVLAVDYPSFDVLVVDQSDDDRTGAIVRDLMRAHSSLRYVHAEPPGLSRAYNAGVRMTSGNVIAFTDDDCVVPPGWLISITRAFEMEPDAAMLYGQVLLPAALGRIRDTVPQLWIPSARRLSRRDGFEIFGMGANFAIRRSLFERIGGFDEVLGGGGPLSSSQDFDFLYRAYLAEAVALLRPEVTVDHYGARNDRQWSATLRAYGIGDGGFYFKHVRCGDLFALRLLVGSVLRVAIREALRWIRGTPSQLEYLHGFLDGVRQSGRYSIDRQTRRYVGAP